jgi:DNA-binding NarL/FixJ family response regulator/transposase-like protein
VPIQVAIGRQGPKESCPAGWCRTKPKDLVCLGCHRTREELLRRVPREKPNALVLDEAVLDGDGSDCVRLLRSLVPGLPVIVISERKEAPAILRSLMSGAQGYLLKPVAPSFLEEAVRQVASAQAVLSPDALSELVGAFNKATGVLPDGSVLSQREQQILIYLALGYRLKEIASALHIGEGTVHSHVHRIWGKLRVPNKRAALRKFLGSGLFPLPNLAPGAAQPQRSRGFPKSFRELRRRFATEEACRGYLFELRWLAGFRCPHCQATRAWRMRRGLWLCQGCHRQISVTGGTIFHETRLPLRVWFQAVWEVAAQKGRVTATGLMRVSELGSYKTAWTCLKKLRRCLDESHCCLGDHPSRRCGERFQCLLQKAVHTPPQPFKKLVARRGRQAEQRE